MRDYGLFAANAFGRHDFESLPDKKAGNLVLPQGQSITFRYRIFFHEGDEKQGKVAEQYEEYARTKVAKTGVSKELFRAQPAKLSQTARVWLSRNTEIK